MLSSVSTKITLIFYIEEKNMECVFYLGNNCITNTERNILIVGAVGLLLLIIGIILYRKTVNEDDQGGIKVTDMDIQKTIPQGESTLFVEEKNSYDHPFQVGTKVFVGEEEGLGAKLEILRYNEDNNEVICRLWIEAPSGSSTVIVDHMQSDSFDHGVAIIQYVYDFRSHTIKIGLVNETLSDSNYTVVVVAISSTLENLQ
jgi:hypothetical protein